jgi:AcrR family transcriptional regulator
MADCMMAGDDVEFENIPPSKRDPVFSASARQEATRQLIIESAKHLFARFGYEGTTLGAVAHGADVAPEDMLQLFDDKLGILMAVFDEGWATINQRLQDIVISSSTARQATLSMFAVMMRILERDEDLARLLLFEGRRPNPETGEIMLSAGYRWFSRLCLELVVRGQKDGSFRSNFNPRAVVSMLTGAVENLMRDRLLEQEMGLTGPLTGAQLMTAFDALVSYLGADKPKPSPDPAH